jgi:hypothetical protein
MLLASFSTLALFLVGVAFVAFFVAGEAYGSQLVVESPPHANTKIMAPII